MALNLRPEPYLARAVSAPAAPAIAFNVGAKTRLGLGGYLTAETASSSLTGTNNGDFKCDNISTIVPATASAGTYGTLWSPAGSSWSLTGASGQVYDITKLANAAHITTRNGAATFADSGGTNETQLYRMFRISTASGGLARGDTVYWRTGAEYNPNSSLWYFEPLALTNFTGSGRITIRSELADATLDSNGNPQLKHGSKMGMVYFNPDVNTVWPLDFRDIWFYTNAATPGTATFFQYAGASSGIGFYNCRIEYGPSVTNAKDIAGLLVKGDTVISGCHFVNIGNTACIQTNTNATTGIAGTSLIENNIIEGSWSDGINFSGSNITIQGNFFFGWLYVVGNHQDPIQYTGGAGGSDNITIRKNLSVLDLGNIVQAMIYISDTDAAAWVTNLNVQNNIGFFGNTHGITMDRCDNPNASFNTMLTDPFMTSDPTQNVAIYLRIAGQNGATVSNNIASLFDLSAQPGTVTATNNITVARSSISRAAYIAKLQVMFPNMPSSQSDSRWKTRAGTLEIFTPANLAVGSGGAVNADGTVSGALFPAPPGTGTVGPWNDGSVYDPSNPTWVAAHPPAT